MLPFDSFFITDGAFQISYRANSIEFDSEEDVSGWKKETLL